MNILNKAKINEFLPEMDLACRKSLQTMCHTLNLNKQNFEQTVSCLNNILLYLGIKLTHIYTPGPTGHIRLYSISYNNNNLCFTKYNYNNITKY